MPQVDEFGRAIPSLGDSGDAAGGGGGASPATGDAVSSYSSFGGPLATPRSYRGEHRGEGGSGAGGETSYRPHERSYREDTRGGPSSRGGRYNDHHHHGHHRSDHHGHHSGGNRSDSHHDRALATSRDGSHHHHHHHHHHSNYRSNSPHRSGGRSGRRGPPSKSEGAASAPPHPSQRYVTDPMLCEFLWKEKQEQKEKDLQAKKEGGDAGETDATKSQEEGLEDSNEKANDASTENPVPGSEDNKEEDANDDKKTYDEYRIGYAWTFLKHFFNQHLDDSWFRQYYSPALMVERAILERRRCHAEAQLMRQDLSVSNNLDKDALQAQFSLTVPSTAPSSSTPGSFSAMTQQPPGPPQIPKAHLCSAMERTLHIHNVPPHVTDEHLRQTLLPVMTEYYQQEKQKAAGETSGKKKKQNYSQQEILDHCLEGIFSSTPNNSNKKEAATAPLAGTNYSGGPSMSSPLSSPPRGLRGGSAFLHRSVFCVCTSAAIKDALWQILIHRTANPGGNADDATNAGKDEAGKSNPNENNKSANGAPETAVHVPRKHETAHLNSTYLDLEVDCTDPYGRTEYDANGQGGAPPDGLAIPPRKAVVPISRYEVTTSTQMGGITLSANLSSPGRFVSDQEAATTMARALDVRYHVPMEDRLDSILEQLSSVIADATTTTTNGDEADDSAKPSNLMLDIAVAYLRRVHLYSFYKTTKAESLGDILSGGAVAALVQLRENVDEEFAEVDKDDLLGQRMDDSIRQALDVDCNAWIAAADWYVDEATDRAAQEIQEMEERASQDWLANHSMDDEGRARCSFHFCHKLFKDESFLSKHLLKKHHAYNQAERAKCHDSFMMGNWEKAPLRPGVPSILVDCGKQFGKVDSLLSGGPEPRAMDPEPALWERKQQQDKLRMERSELRATRHRPDFDRKHKESAAPSITSPLSTPRHQGGGGGRSFVDVDDMKEETVEVSFDQVQVPVPVPSKKKKKKRKLL